MNAPKFTPGPWIEDITPSVAPDSFMIRAKAQKCDNWVPIARVFNDMQTEANSHLISAAPELYDALKDVLAAYHGLTLGRQDTEWEGQFKVKARGALAKAEGEAK